MKYNTMQYNTIQHNTIQYNTIQYNTIHLMIKNQNKCCLIFFKCDIKKVKIKNLVKDEFF